MGKSQPTKGDKQAKTGFGLSRDEVIVKKLKLEEWKGEAPCPGKLKKKWTMQFKETKDDVPGVECPIVEPESETNPLDYSMRNDNKDNDDRLDVDTNLASSKSDCVPLRSSDSISPHEFPRLPPTSRGWSHREWSMPSDPSSESACRQLQPYKQNVSNFSSPELQPPTKYPVPPPGQFASMLQPSKSNVAVSSEHLRSGPQLKDVDLNQEANLNQEAIKLQMTYVSISQTGPRKASQESPNYTRRYQQQNSPSRSMSMSKPLPMPVGIGMLVDAAHLVGDSYGSSQSAQLYGANFNGQVVNPGMGFEFETLPRERSYSSGSAVSNTSASGAHNYYHGLMDEVAGSHAPESPSSQRPSAPTTPIDSALVDGSQLSLLVAKYKTGGSHSSKKKQRKYSE